MKKSFFIIKDLVFYGVMISGVVALFSGVSRYGESHLKAPAKIAGRYRLQTQALPACLAGKPLVLDLEQSGVYLNGSLLLAEQSAQEIGPEHQPSLMGSWQQNRLELSGLPAHIPACWQPQAIPTPAVSIEGTIEQSALKGQLRLTSMPNAVDFVAIREDPAPQPARGAH